MDIITLGAAKAYTIQRLANVATAYDVWLSNGNVGTVDEFLASLMPTLEFHVNTNGELEVTINGNS